MHVIIISYHQIIKTRRKIKNHFFHFITLSFARLEQEKEKHRIYWSIHIKDQTLLP
jgi:hypothetical protein